MHTDHSCPKGTVHRLTVTADILAQNMLGDPVTRFVDVYVPNGTDGAGLPLLVDLVGFTGSGLSHSGFKSFGESVPERLDRLIANAEMPPAVVAFPDCFTRLGGNQYINSVAMGPWEDWLIAHMLPEVERRFSCGGDGRRAVFGKSSGGYGAMVHALRHPDVWAAAACHSGDMAFDLCYLRDMPAALRALAKDGSVQQFMDRFEAGPKYSGADIHVLMVFAMAATYDPDPQAPFGVRLPVDLHSCEVIPERWAQWLAWDPLTIAQDRAEALASLKGLWIDCGARDQYDLVYGARRMHRLLQARGIAHQYEEFDDDHSDISYRMDKSLPFLAKALG